MVAIFMNVQRVPSWAMLLAYWTHKALRLQVLCFNMHTYYGGTI